jgi:hypothetical protein
MKAAVCAALLLCASTLAAHDGPPFPIVSDRIAGAYTISIWTDPDATDDGSAGGQFWVTLKASAEEAAVPEATHIRVAVRPLDRPGPAIAAAAAPVSGQATNQFAALLMDHEGPYAVRVEIEGPLGGAAIDARVDATYDLRPPPYMIAWYVAPFVVVGALWTRLLLRRRAGTR